MWGVVLVLVLVVVTGGKQSQLLLQSTKVKLGLQVRSVVRQNVNYAILIWGGLRKINTNIYLTWYIDGSLERSI